MPLISCPGCGHLVADVAPECPRCTRARPGLRHTGPTVAKPGGGGSVSWAVGLIGAGTAILLLIGLMVAAAAPRAPRPTQRELRRQRGEQLVRAIYAAEVQHRRGTRSFDRSVLADHPELSSADYYHAWISKAEAGALCIEAEPLPDAGRGLPRLSMNERGVLFEGPGCTEPASRPVPASIRSRQKDAEMMLDAAYEMERQHFASAHRYDPDLPSYRAIPGSPYFRLRITRATATELCIEAVPFGGTGLRTQSLDEAGYLHDGPGCRDR